MFLLLFICAVFGTKLISEHEISDHISGKIICDLCKSLINSISNLDGHIVKEYLESLCAKASGFLNSICIKIADFGIDQLVKLLYEKVQSDIICSKIKAC